MYPQHSGARVNAFLGSCAMFVRFDIMKYGLISYGTVATSVKLVDRNFSCTLTRLHHMRLTFESSVLEGLSCYCKRNS